MAYGKQILGSLVRGKTPLHVSNHIETFKCNLYLINLGHYDSHHHGFLTSISDDWYTKSTWSIILGWDEPIPRSHSSNQAVNKGGKKEKKKKKDKKPRA